jgi:hypothetical protein
LERNVLYGSVDAVAGVERRRVLVTNNYRDDAKPFWYPEDKPWKGVTLVGNMLLPRVDPLSECRADSDCADILAGAGPRRGR